MATSNVNKGFVAFCKKAWSGYPEVVGSSLQGLVGIAIGLYAVKRYYENDGDNRRHKEFYTVYRHDDPRVEKIKKD